GPARVSLSLSAISYSFWDYVFLAGLGFITNLMGHFGGLVFRVVSSGQLVWFATITSTISLIAIVLAVWLAGTMTGRIWRETPPSPQQIWLEKTFCTPIIWISFFRAWMKHKLEVNPVGWLEQRTWSGRLITWGWLAVIISLYSVMLSDPTFFQRTSVPQNLMAWLLVLSMA